MISLAFRHRQQGTGLESGGKKPDGTPDTKHADSSAVDFSATIKSGRYLIAFVANSYFPVCYSPAILSHIQSGKHLSRYETEEDQDENDWTRSPNFHASDGFIRDVKKRKGFIRKRTYFKPRPTINPGRITA
jgi:hypothetical protein